MLKLVNPLRGQLGSEEKLGLEAHGSAPSVVPRILILLRCDGKPRQSRRRRQPSREGGPTLERSLKVEQVTPEGQLTCCRERGNTHAPRFLATVDSCREPITIRRYLIGIEASGRSGNDRDPRSPCG